MHNQMVWKILRAPMYFFDKNSIGAIQTKFTKDIQGLGKHNRLILIDDYIPNFSFIAIRYSTQLLASLIVAAITVPFMAAIIVVVVLSVW